MANDTPSGASDREREVISAVGESPRSPAKSPKFIKRFKKALLAAGGIIAAGTAAPIALEGCAFEAADPNGHEHIGQTSEALVSGWNSPTKPNLGLTGSTSPASIDHSGSNITAYVINNSSGKPHIYEVGTADGVNWNSPSATMVPGANSSQDDIDFKICGSTAFVVSGRDGLSDKLYMGSWSGGAVGALSPVPGNLNGDFSAVYNVACDSSGNVYATSDALTTNVQILTTSIASLSGSPTWNVLTTCSDPTKNTYGMFIGTKDFFIGTDRTGTKGSSDIFVYNNTWNGTNCSGSATNLNNIAGSAVINDVNAQDYPIIDGVGDLWLVSNGSVEWATALAAAPDAGTDAGGDATDSGTADAADAAPDAPDDVMEAGSPDASDASDSGMTMPDSGAPDASDAGDSGMTMPDAGNPDASDSGMPMKDAGNDGSMVTCSTVVVNPMDSKICNVDCNTTGQDTISLQDGNCQLKYTDLNGYVMLSVSSADFVSGQTVTMGINGGTATPDPGFSIDKMDDYGTGLILNTKGFQGAPEGTGWNWQWQNDHLIKSAVVDGTVGFVNNGVPIEIPGTQLTNGKVTGAQQASDPNRWNFVSSAPYLLWDTDQANVVGSSFKNPNDLPVSVPPKGGCSCETVVGDTSSDLNGLFLAAGLVGIVVARKRKGFIGVESNQDKA